MCPDNLSTFVEESKISVSLEGKSRPGHFKGVSTIVAKFFNIINPTHAFFGEKDAQQLRVIQRMVIDLDYDIKIIPCKTIREKSGLAMSSRNENLSNKDRKIASIIYKGLKLAETAIFNGEKSAINLKKCICSIINSEPNTNILYVSIADSKSLIEIEEIDSNESLISVAVEIGSVRLIDSITYSISWIKCVPPAFSWFDGGRYNR